jgi:DNA polymerase-1
MSSPKQSGTFLLVDGNSLLYRSFFAIPRLTNKEGMPTNAVYGLATALRKILADEKPERAAVVFDAPGKTFRHEIYDEYKANRPETPDDLAVQFPHARRLCEVLGLSLLEIEGVEADDVIGTLASKAEKLGYMVIAVTSDKDFFQIVTDRVHVIHPGKDVRFDPERVSEKFGVPPDEVVDVLALMGDNVDNVPGVPGIGEKGAVTLIKKWGSLEACLQNAEKITNKRQREGLLNYAEQARLSKKLVRIDSDLPLDLDIESLEYRGAERAAAFALLEKLGFTTLLKDYLPEEETRPKATYRLIGSLAELGEKLEEAKTRGRIAVCLRLAEPGSMTSPIQGIGFASEPGFGFVVPVGGKWAEKELLHRLDPVLSDASLPKVGHDLKSLWRCLFRHGIALRGIEFDTMIASYVLNPSKRSHGPETLAMEVLQESLTEPQAPKGQRSLPGMGNEPEEGHLLPAAEKAEVALRLQERLASRIEDEGLDTIFRTIEIPLIEVLADMERLGIRLDVELLRSLSGEISEGLDALTEEIYGLAGTEFNVNSPKQVGEILFEKMNLPVFKKTQKQRAASTRMEVLEELAEHFELPKKILDYRSLGKLKGTYVDALPNLVNAETGRIHTSFNQSVAATGRLSSSDPNLQNIPIRTDLGRRIRSAFVAEPGWQLLSADYSQIELRVLAHMSADSGLIEAFQRGEDIHEATAQRVFGMESGLTEAEQRRRAKIINFSIIYGKTAFTLGKDLGVSTREAQAFIDAYFERHPKVQELLEKIVKEARRTGKVKTLFGRHRYIPEIGSRNRNTRQAAERVAVNAPIQGTAADLVKKAMVDLWHELHRRELRSRLLLQVHDELVLEVPEDEGDTVSKLVREVMETVHRLEVPLKVDVALGKSWLH